MPNYVEIRPTVPAFFTYDLQIAWTGCGVVVQADCDQPTRSTPYAISFIIEGENSQIFPSQVLLPLTEFPCDEEEELAMTPPVGTIGQRLILTMAYGSPDGPPYGERRFSILYSPLEPLSRVLAGGYLATGLSSSGGTLDFWAVGSNLDFNDTVAFFYLGQPLGIPLSGNGGVYRFTMTFDGPLPSTVILLETGINGEVKWPYLKVE